MSGKIALLYDPAVLEHQPPEGHPERPARVREVMALLEAKGLLERVTRLEIVPATRGQIERVHTASCQDKVERIVARGVLPNPAEGYSRTLCCRRDTCRTKDESALAGFALK